MAQIKIEAFGGMIPAVDRRLLPPNAAQESKNVWLYDGRLCGFREPKLIYTLANPDAQRVYRIPTALTNPENIVNSTWLEFNSAECSVVESPLKDEDPEDKRYYWAGDTPAPFEPRYTSGQSITEGRDPLLLGVPQPTSALTVVPAGGVSATMDTRSYVHTLVTVYGEEGPPSDPTAVLTNKIDATWTVTIPAVNSERGPAALAVTGITQAASAVVTCVGHGLSVGNRVFFAAVTGMTQINGLYGTVTQVTGANTFVVNIDSTAFTAYAAGGTVQLTEREITHIRLYRTVVSAQGVATYFYVTELPVLTTSYADTILPSVVSLNEQLTSGEYFAPTTLDGFVAMPNGSMLGWKDNQIYFSEPYKPHAWPVSYQRATEFNIVGVGVIGQTAVICTEGIPYLCTGSHPANMTLTKIGAMSYPCSSKNGIVALPNGVYYPSYQGLVMISAGAPEIATRTLMSQNNWQSLVAADYLNATLFNGSYIGYSGLAGGAFDSGAFDDGAFAMGSVGDSRAGVIIDFNDARIALNKVEFDYQPVNIQRDIWTSEVLVIMNGAVYQLDLAERNDEGSYVWWSKEYRMDKPTNMGVGRVFYDRPSNFTEPVTGTISFYGNGELIYSRSMPESGAEFRLPSGTTYDFYSVKIEGNMQMHQVQLATTAKELRGM